MSMFKAGIDRSAIGRLCFIVCLAGLMALAPCATLANPADEQAAAVEHNRGSADSDGHPINNNAGASDTNSERESKDNVPTLSRKSASRRLGEVAVLMRPRLLLPGGPGPASPFADDPWLVGYVQGNPIDAVPFNWPSRSYIEAALENLRVVLAAGPSPDAVRIADFPALEPTVPRVVVFGEDSDNEFRNAKPLELYFGMIRVPEAIELLRDYKFAPIRRALEGGASANGTDKNGAPFLYMAAFLGRTKFVRYLLDRGAKVDAPVKHGGTPLMAAADNGHADVAKLLIERGANPNARTNAGLTPIWCAARLDNAQLTEVLLRAGANPNFRDPNLGWTPLMMAVMKENVSVVKVLLSNGADPNLRDKDGMTALQSARMFHLDRMVQMLSSNKRH